MKREKFVSNERIGQIFRKRTELLDTEVKIMVIRIP